MHSAIIRKIQKRVSPLRIRLELAMRVEGEKRLYRWRERHSVVGKLTALFDVVSLPRILLKNRWQMTQRNVEQRYRGSLLGLVWSFVQPLMMLTVYTFVFSVVFKAKWGVASDGGRGAFAVIMFCGMTMYNLFSEAVITSCMSVVNNQNLVKKVIFPLEILPVVCVFTTYILGLPWFLLLLAGSYFILGFIGVTMLLLPIVLIPLIIFTTGLSFLVAALGVYMRDTQYALGIVLQILFFATPIFYPTSAVPAHLRGLLSWNPLTVFIEQARNVFLFGKLPDWTFLGLATLVSFVVLQVGVFFFVRTKKGFADVI